MRMWEWIKSILFPKPPKPSKPTKVSKESNQESNLFAFFLF